MSEDKTIKSSPPIVPPTPTPNPATPAPTPSSPTPATSSPATPTPATPAPTPSSPTPATSSPATPTPSVNSRGASSTVAKDLYGSQKRGRSAGQNSRERPRGGRNNRQKDDLEQRILEISRVTRVMAGGKRMSFRACVAIGDKKGNVGVGLGKGADVTIAINKAVNRAKKSMINVPLVNDTIPHVILNKTGGARIILKPARKGRGVISGGVTRMILELAGVKNVTSKNLGSKNKINNARCAIGALHALRRREVKETKTKEIKEIKTEVAELKK